MALRVWLPLNGDLHNQGLSRQINNISTTPIWAPTGKIGKNALYTKTRMTTMNFPELNGVSIYSIAYWLYIPTEVAPTAWSDMFGIQFKCSDGTNVWERDERRAATTTGRHNYHLAKSGSEGTNTNAYYGTKEDDSANNNWIHVVLTKDNNSAKLYFNGQLQVTVAASAFEDAPRTMTGNIYLGDNGCEAYLQDFRIYDHCLSKKEIEEISKGLILHYKLDNNGLGNPNNINPSKVVNRGCTSFSYNSLENFWTLTCPINSSTWGVGFAISDTSIKWKVREAWVISMEVYTPQTINWQKDINNKPDIADNSSYTGNDYDTTGNRPAYTNGSSGQTLSPGWNKIWFAQIAGTSYGLYNYSTNWGIVTTSLTEPITIKIKNIKGEIISAGDSVQPTSYSPFLVNQDNIIYDSSGYQNDSNLVGSLTISSLAPRYNASSLFESYLTPYTQLQNTSILSVITNGSISWWEYCTTTENSLPFVGQSGSYYIGAGSQSTRLYDSNIGTTATIYKDGILETNHTSSGATNYHGGIFHTQGSWHHFVLTNINLSSWTQFYINHYSTGWPLNAYLSDVRIYATVLTTEQIKELYNTSATVDKNGNMYVREAVEL